MVSTDYIFIAHRETFYKCASGEILGSSAVAFLLAMHKKRNIRRKDLEEV